MRGFRGILQRYAGALAAAIAVTLLALAPPAIAQTVAYDAGSIYDLDPPANQATGNRILEQVAGSNDMEPVRELGEGDVYRRLSRPVGRFAYARADGRPAFCTASLIADNLILTNHHCIAEAREALLWMGYLKPRSREGVAQYPVVLPPLEVSEALDYAILEVRGNPGREWGTITLAPAPVARRQSLFVVHHPGGFEKHITLGGCRASDPAEDGDDLLHHCDTMGGSSGAPIFDVASRRVVGLHYSAVALKGLNAGKRMARLVAASARLRDLAPAEKAPSAAAPAAPAPQAPLSAAALEWQVMRGTTSCAELATFLTRHGGSPFASYAEARQRELKCAEEKVAVGVFDGGPTMELPPCEGGIYVDLSGKGRTCVRPGNFSSEIKAGCNGVEVALASSETRCIVPGSGESFRDCPDCPEMVVVPAGGFLMGSPESEKDRSSDEGPQRRVTLGQPFAVGKFEVTFAEWDACVAAKACRHKPEDAGWGRGRRPVMNVSWDDIKNEYLPWLNRTLGLSGAGAYRLLSEAEWEYAARAGTTTPFSFGPTISTDQANYDGNFTYGSGRTGPYRQKTVEVGSFPSNAFGLHDMHGNVNEWVEDTWSASYSGAPVDGAEWVQALSTYRRVLRGGSRADYPGTLRAAERNWAETDTRDSHIGFRVARSLSR